MKRTNEEYLFLAIAPGVVAPDRVLSMDNIELDSLLMLN